jgi:predicted RNase H-like HicB family nuclease
MVFFVENYHHIICNLKEGRLEMNCLCTAYIEKDVESGMYVGYVPGIIGAHTCAETIDKLKDKLTEVVALCIEEMFNLRLN